MTPPRWGFLTNHALVMIFVIRHPDTTVREVAAGVGVTERATLAILRQLEDEGIVARHKEGRRNTYAVDFDRLAAYRREGTVQLTPRIFVDGLINTLLQLADYEGRTNGAVPAEVNTGGRDPQIGAWGFFTNHALLLLSIAVDRSATVREIALNVGITERAVVALLDQLESEGIIVRRKQGRRNMYVIDSAALRRFPRWSPGEWQVPPQLVDVAVDGLAVLSASSPNGAEVVAGRAADVRESA
jgi:DNA-binding MarR family transcriptional regulator